MSSVIRLPNWEDRLKEYFAECAAKSFKWGSHDCALFAAGAVLAMTGQDFGEPFRGRYSTPRGSIRALRKFGAGTLEATFTAALGASKPISLAKRGDIVLIRLHEDDPRTATMGVCCGKYSQFVGALDDTFQLLPPHDDTAKPYAGLIPVPTTTCLRAWTVAF